MARIIEQNSDQLLEPDVSAFLDIALEQAKAFGYVLDIKTLYLTADLRNLCNFYYSIESRNKSLAAKVHSLLERLCCCKLPKDKDSLLRFKLPLVMYFAGMSKLQGEYYSSAALKLITKTLSDKVTLIASESKNEFKVQMNGLDIGTAQAVGIDELTFFATVGLTAGQMRLVSDKLMSAQKHCAEGIYKNLTQ